MESHRFYIAFGMENGLDSPFLTPFLTINPQYPPIFPCGEIVPTVPRLRSSQEAPAFFSLGHVIESSNIFRPYQQIASRVNIHKKHQKAMDFLPTFHRSTISTGPFSEDFIG
jgi:hypothetical protein